MGRKPTSSRKFDGKIYRAMVVRKTKQAGKDTAANFRRKGTKARVIKDKSGYVVWIRTAK